MASHIFLYCSFLMLNGFAGTQSQTNTATVTVGNFMNDILNVSFNGSGATQCSGFSYTEPLEVSLLDNIAGATSPFIVEENLYTVVCNNRVRVVLYLNSSADNNTEYTISFYGNYSFWINVTSPGQQWLPTLGMDQALLIVVNNYSYPVEYSSVSSACYKCLPSNNVTIRPGAIQPIVVDSNYPLSYSLSFPNGTVVCPPGSYPFVEGEIVTVTVRNTGGCTELNIDKNATLLHTLLPIVYAATALIGSAIVWSLGYYVYILWIHPNKHCLHLGSLERIIAKDLGDPKETSSLVTRDIESSISVNHGGTSPSPGRRGSRKKPKGSNRLLSLDAFRGFSLTIVLFVNYGGGGYYFFDHSLWHGLTVADLVFPWFVWIMGVSLVFSFKGRSKDTFLSQLYQVFRRTMILIGLGLFVNNGFHLDTWRIPGVLQRFGATYFVCALTELLTSYLYQVEMPFKPCRHKYLAFFHDLTNNWVQWIIMVTFTFLWLMLTFLLPLDNGCPTGYLGPGGISEGGKYFNCTGGAAAKIDNWILGQKHIYKHPTSQAMYNTGPYDPEGILGTLTSIVLCFLGVQCGRVLTSYQSHLERIGRFLFWGVLLGAIATGLCEGEQYEGIIPINKNLWSLSFILLMASFGFILFTVFYTLCDVVHVWNGSPFRFPGMNSILVYVSSDIFYNYFPFVWAQQGNSHLNLLSANLVAVSVWVLLSYYWYRIGFFVKI